MAALDTGEAAWTIEATAIVNDATAVLTGEDALEYNDGALILGEDA